MGRERSWWGWGWQDEAIAPEGIRAFAPIIADRLQCDVEVRQPTELSALQLRPPRIAPPSNLGRHFHDDTRIRAAHTFGKSFRDVVRGFRGEFDSPPDLVATPDTESDVVSILDWASDANVAVIPYGGGSSVVGGVECAIGDAYAGAVSLDLTLLNQVVEIDRISRAARIQAGALGPVLEDQLRPHGYTLRHFPQSFEFSTLGGWLATRSGGHYATVYTHIDDMTESMRVVTPSGIIESRRLPGSGAGPSPDRMFLGSEGSLGVITEAWMRIQDRPTFRASASAHFPSMAAGAAAVREISQAALFPANCRLLDPEEARANAGVDDGSAVLVVGFESAHHPVEALLDVALTAARDHGGSLPRPPKVVHPDATTTAAPDASDAWRKSFLHAPYGRDALVALGIVVETFETAVTWDRFEEFHQTVTSGLRSALDQICGGGIVSCRFTHVYPDGPAPYYTVFAPSRHGQQIEMWDEVKAIASQLLIDNGGTITHHHAVGRDHRPWYDQQRPDGFATAMQAAKTALDPAGIMNPGSVFDPS